ncbi:MAG: hypothetical protein QM813_10895 [Verrucomicrobiota bacterium]
MEWNPTEGEIVDEMTRTGNRDRIGVVKSLKAQWRIRREHLEAALPGQVDAELESRAAVIAAQERAAELASRNESLIETISICAVSHIPRRNTICGTDCDFLQCLAVITDCNSEGMHILERLFAMLDQAVHPCVIFSGCPNIEWLCCFLSWIMDCLADAFLVGVYIFLHRFDV